MRMTNTHQDARMYRFLDCTTICDERFCYFCASCEGVVQPLCAPCNGFGKRD